MAFTPEARRGGSTAVSAASGAWPRGRSEIADATGRATLRWTFSPAGSWYVGARALVNPNYAAIAVVGVLSVPERARRAVGHVMTSTQTDRVSRAPPSPPPTGR